MIGKVLTACIMLASQTYEVPPAVLVGIFSVEGGKVGQEVKNTNGSYDMGPMQINSLWIPELSKHWGVGHDTARSWIRDDACTNVGVSAWILRNHLNKTGSLSTAISYYHSRTPRLGKAYKSKVINAMRAKGLVY